MAEDNATNRPASHAAFVEGLNNILSAKLDEFGVILSPSESIPAIIKWTLSSAVQQNVTVNDLILSVDDLDEIADAIRDLLLLEIAEERPGTDPWEHRSTIPIPLPIAMMTLHTLSVCTRIAIDNRATRWAHIANTLITSWANAISQSSLRHSVETGEMEVLLSDSHKTVTGTIVKLPQPGVAYTARMIESFSKRVDSRWWSLTDEPNEGSLSPVEVDHDTRETLIRNLDQNAVMLRDFNERYGATAQPRQGS